MMSRPVTNAPLALALLRNGHSFVCADLKVIEASVRAITKVGLYWAAAQLEPVAYGLKKLRIIAIVHDDIISVDDLQEEIEQLPGVRSTDVHAFNKV